ncbi:MAG: hypothetical protein COA79_20415 [Planctomycetota bacterium]|nr:MAG: hypothetical protein COA79_20415 [Planctomycetota bacterium]
MKFVSEPVFFGLLPHTNEATYFIALVLLTLLFMSISNRIGHLKSRICLAATNTVEYNETLTVKERLSAMRKSRGGAWCSGHWKPRCMTSTDAKCTTPRMDHRSYGFECPDRGNMIGFNLQRLEESPFYKKTQKTAPGNAPRLHCQCLYETENNLPRTRRCFATCQDQFKILRGRR